jgi:hypothetical protein
MSNKPPKASGLTLVFESFKLPAQGTQPEIEVEAAEIQFQPEHAGHWFMVHLALQGNIPEYRVTIGPQGAPSLVPDADGLLGMVANGIISLDGTSIERLQGVSLPSVSLPM